MIDFLVMKIDKLVRVRVDSLEYDLPDGISRDDDILLNCIALFSTIAIDPEVAPLVCSSKLFSLLFTVYSEKESDVEMVLQIFYCLYMYLLHIPSTKLIQKLNGH